MDKGVVSGGGKTVTYGQLVGDKLMNVKFTTTTLNTGVAPAKNPSQYKQVGIARVQHYDIPEIVTGVAHLRGQRPRARACSTAASCGRAGRAPTATARTRCRSRIDADSIKHIPGVQIVRVGNFLAVVAPKEYDAIQAASILKVKWSDPPKIDPVGNLWLGMRQRDSAGLAPARIAAQGPTTPGSRVSSRASTPRWRRPRRRTRARSSTTTRCTRPIGPNVSVADVTANSAIIFGHVKNGYGVTRSQVAAALNSAAQKLGLPNTYDLSRVRVVYYEGSSSFGGGAAHVDNDECAAVCSLVGRQARPRAVDALGRARLGQLRPGHDVGREGRHRRQRQAGRLGRHQHRHGGVREDADRAADRTADVRPGRRPRRHDLLGNAVRHPEPADHRQDA